MMTPVALTAGASDGANRASRRPPIRPIKAGVERSGSGPAAAIAALTSSRASRDDETTASRPYRSRRGDRPASARRLSRDGMSRNDAMAHLFLKRLEADLGEDLGMDRGAGPGRRDRDGDLERQRFRRQAGLVVAGLIAQRAI